MNKIKKMIKNAPPRFIVILALFFAYLIIYQIITSVNTSPDCITLDIYDVTIEQSGYEASAVIHCHIKNNSTRDCKHVEGSLTISDNNNLILTETDWSFGNWGNFLLSSDEAKTGTITISANESLLLTPFSEMKFDITIKNATYLDSSKRIFRFLYHILLYPFCAVFVFCFGIAIIALGGALLGLLGNVFHLDSGKGNENDPVDAEKKKQWEEEAAAKIAKHKRQDAYYDARKRYESAAMKYRNAMNSPNNADLARMYQNEMELAKVDMINSGFTYKSDPQTAYYDAKKSYESAAMHYRHVMNSPNNADLARMYQEEMELAKIEMINSGYSEK